MKSRIFPDILISSAEQLYTFEKILLACCSCASLAVRFLRHEIEKGLRAVYPVGDRRWDSKYNNSAKLRCRYNFEKEKGERENEIEKGR